MYSLHVQCFAFHWAEEVGGRPLLPSPPAIPLGAIHLCKITRGDSYIAMFRIAFMNVSFQLLMSVRLRAVKLKWLALARQKSVQTCLVHERCYACMVTGLSKLKVGLGIS